MDKNIEEVTACLNVSDDPKVVKHYTFSGVTVLEFDKDVTRVTGSEVLAKYVPSLDLSKRIHLVHHDEVIIALDTENKDLKLLTEQLLSVTGEPVAAIIMSPMADKSDEFLDGTADTVVFEEATVDAATQVRVAHNLSELSYDRFSIYYNKKHDYYEINFKGGLIVSCYARPLISDEDVC